MTADNYKVLERINYGYIVYKSETYLEGTVFEHERRKYNILKDDGKLICKDWFDIYLYDLDGICRIGYKKNENEIEEMKNYYQKNEYDNYMYNWGSINKNGNIVINPIYDYLRLVDSDTYIGCINNKKGYINANNGNNVTPIIFDYAEPFVDCKAYVEYETENEIFCGTVNRFKIFQLYEWLNQKNVDKVLIKK